MSNIGTLTSLFKVPKLSKLVTIKTDSSSGYSLSISDMGKVVRFNMGGYNSMFTIKLPPAYLITKEETVTICCTIPNTTLIIRDMSGNYLKAITYGKSITLICVNKSSAAGKWIFSSTGIDDSGILLPPSVSAGFTNTPYEPYIIGFTDTTYAMVTVGNAPAATLYATLYTSNGTVLSSTSLSGFYTGIISAYCKVSNTRASLLVNQNTTDRPYAIELIVTGTTISFNQIGTLDNASVQGDCVVVKYRDSGGLCINAWMQGTSVYLETKPNPFAAGGAPINIINSVTSNGLQRGKINVAVVSSSYFLLSNGVYIKCYYQSGSTLTFQNEYNISTIAFKAFAVKGYPAGGASYPIFAYYTSTGVPCIRTVISNASGFTFGAQITLDNASSGDPTFNYYEIDVAYISPNLIVVVYVNSSANLVCKLVYNDTATNTLTVLTTTGVFLKAFTYQTTVNICPLSEKSFRVTATTDNYQAGWYSDIFIIT
jgi:hypothetical protein